MDQGVVSRVVGKRHLEVRVSEGILKRHQNQLRRLGHSVAADDYEFFSQMLEEEPREVGNLENFGDVNNREADSVADAFPEVAAAGSSSVRVDETRRSARCNIGKAPNRYQPDDIH